MLSGDERDRTANFTGCKPGALTIDLTKDAEPESCEFSQRLRAARVGPVAGGPAAARTRLDYQSQPTAPIVSQNSFPRETGRHCPRSSIAVGRSHGPGWVLRPFDPQPDDTWSRLLRAWRSAQQLAPEHGHRLADQG